MSIEQQEFEISDLKFQNERGARWSSFKFEISNLKSQIRRRRRLKYERFEDLPVWKAAAELAVQIFAWSSHPWFRGKGDLASQLQRAALSVSNNFAEAI